MAKRSLCPANTAPRNTSDRHTRTANFVFTSKSIPVTKRAYAESTEKGFKLTTRAWVEYCKGAGIEEWSSQPTEGTLQNFIDFLCVSRQGQVVDIVSKRYVHGMYRGVVSLIYQKTGQSLDKDMPSRLLQYIVKHGGCAFDRRIQHHATYRDHHILSRYLWCHDDYDYLHERSRIQLAFTLLLLSGSGGRIGSYIVGNKRKELRTLRYKDVELFLVRRESQASHSFLLRIGQRYRKGDSLIAQDVRHTDEINGFLLGEQPTAWFNAIPLFFALAFADNIFGDQYSTIESLLQQPLGDSEEIIPIGFCEEALEVPVLQVCDVNGGTGKPLHYRSLRNPLIELGHRAGYPFNIGAHAFRRGVGNAIDGHISQAARDKLMGHANAAFRQSYVTNTCLLDVQSVVAGRASAEDFGTLLQSMSKHRVINPPRSLPLERMSLLRRQPVLKNIEREEKEAMKDMKQTTASGMGVKKHRNKLDTIRKKKRRFLKRELIKFWNEMKARQQGPHRQNTAHASMIALSLFDIYKRWLPERNTMAQHLFSESFDLWSPTGLIVIRDMMELAGKGRNRAIFNRDEAPVNGKCAMCLKKQYTRIDEFRKHTYKCHADQKSGEAYALFQKAESVNHCPLCDECFLSREEWRAHCHQHLQNPTAQCGIIRLRGLVIHPGLCPFCMGDKSQHASTRFEMWRTESSHVEHLRLHLMECQTNFSPMVRPHPSCELELDSWDATCDHLITIHRLPACTFEIEDESIECKDNPNTLCGLKDGDEVELDNSLNDYLDPAAFDDLSSASTQMIEGNNFQAMEMLETDFLEMDDIQSFCN